MVEGTSITAHLEADSNAAREAADLAAANLEMSRQYADFGGAFHLLKFDRKGEAKPIRLCNFTAEIEREVVKNDGLTTSRHFKVSGILETGEAMPTIDVPASEFDRSDGLGAAGDDLLAFSLTGPQCAPVVEEQPDASPRPRWPKPGAPLGEGSRLRVS